MSTWESIIDIKGTKIGNGLSPYIVAEMACAHDGIFEKAIELVEAAVNAAADAVQLQFFVPDETVTPAHPVHALLQKIAFSKQQWAQIFEYAKKKGIHVWVCTYDETSVAWAKEFGADGIKLNSADLSNPDVLAKVAKTGIPFTLGTGASSLEEVHNGLDWLQKNGATKGILMHGVQNFPTAIADLNVARLRLLQRVFPFLPSGYADHTEGEHPFAKQVDLMAVAMGASVIEKHITKSRAEKGIDYQAALEPEELKAFVETIRNGFTALGQPVIKSFSESDLRYRKFQKKSVVAAIDIKKGEVLDRQKVRFLRNEVPGLPPIQFASIEGKTLKRDVAMYDNILLEDLA